MPPNKRAKFLIDVLLVLMLVALFLKITNIIALPDLLYSRHIGFKLQVQSFFEGKFNVGESIEELREDHTWFNQKVQQASGLGVPILRLPFEALAKIYGAGEEGFPDLLIFLIFYILLAVLTLKAMKLLASKLDMKYQTYFAYLTTLLITLFPPFIAILRSRFSIYEEVIAYGYIFGIALLLFLIFLWATEKTWSWYAICLTGLLCPQIRPTLICYSVLAIFLGILLAYKKIARIHLILGSCLFAAGIFFFFWSNTVRFGHPLEAGHSCFVASNISMVNISCFKTPYEESPDWFGKTKELYGILFRSSESKLGFPAFSENIFPGQFPLLRWRFIYFITYTNFIAILFFISPLLALLLRKHKSLDIKLLGSYALLPFIGLSIFYIKIPYISSRYLIDFGPAIIAGLLLFLLLQDQLLKNLSRYSAKLSLLLATTIILQINWHYYFMAPLPSDKTKAVSAKNVGSQLAEDRRRIIKNRSSGHKPFHRLGWSNKTKEVENAALFIVPSPAEIRLDFENVSSADILKLSKIKAKLSNEPLDIIDLQLKADKATIVFSTPRAKYNQNGYQILTVQFMPITTKIQKPEYKLAGIRWRSF